MILHPPTLHHVARSARHEMRALFLAHTSGFVIYTCALAAIACVPSRPPSARRTRLLVSKMVAIAITNV